MTEVVRVFTFHAEGLERDDVWRRASDLLDAVEARGGRATLFVDPHAAIETGFDLGPRLRELLDRGHEVGQRTSFEAGASIEEVRRCLDRDLGCLRDAGADPVGSVVGGWAIPQEALAWLREHAFAYDSTFLSSEGGTPPTMQDGLLRLPTTASLLRIAKRRGEPVIAGSLAYELGYIRDGDLTGFAKRMAAGTALRRWGDAGPLIAAADLASRIRMDAGR